MSSPSSSSSERNREIYNFLSSHPIAVLASVDPNGDPHAAVIYFSVNDNFEIMFTTKKETKKYDNLKHNSHVTLVCFEASSQTTVEITGEVKEIDDIEALEKAFSKTILASIKTSDSGIPPIAKLKAGNYVAFKIEPKRIAMAVFSEPDPGGYELFKTIDF